MRGVELLQSVLQRTPCSGYQICLIYSVSSSSERKSEVESFKEAAGKQSEAVSGTTAPTVAMEPVPTEATHRPYRDQDAAGRQNACLMR
jgi:hypothetical protein